MVGYNYRKIKKEISETVWSACCSKKNIFTDSVWPYHILPVVKHSLALGKKLKADLEVLELSALLHDYAGIVNAEYYEEHHAHGARLAEGLLRKLKYPEIKIDSVKNCILCHRGGVVLRKKSLEAKILASADAMSHITEPVDMFYLTFYVRRLETEAGAAWLKAKLERSWKKIMPEGKAFVRKEY